MYARHHDNSLAFVCSGLLLAFAFLIPMQSFSRLPTSIASQEWRIVRLAEKEPDGFHFVATGFALVRNKKAFVVTSAHILEKVHDPSKFYADFAPPMKAHAVTVWSKDSTDDLAVLATSVEINGELEERAAEPTVKAPVFIVGFDDAHTTRDQINIQSGAVETVGLWAEEKHFFIISGKYQGPTAPAMLISGVTCRLGGSGSPVFGSEGEILGVVKGFTGDRKCLAIDIQPALRLLEKYSQ
jgi:hypothetical protein